MTEQDQLLFLIKINEILIELQSQNLISWDNKLKTLEEISMSLVGFYYEESPSYEVENMFWEITRLIQRFRIKVEDRLGLF